MELKDILNDDVSHDEAKEAIKEHVRSVVDSFVTEKKDKDYESKDSDSDSDSDEEEDDEEEDDEDDDKKKMDENLNEAMMVQANTPSGRSEEFKINKMSELKKYAKTGKYDYFVVTDKQGNETDYSVDPSGNLTEM